jgi:hypothetical protein
VHHCNPACTLSPASHAHNRPVAPLTMVERPHLRASLALSLALGDALQPDPTANTRTTMQRIAGVVRVSWRSMMAADMVRGSTGPGGGGERQPSTPAPCNTRQTTQGTGNMVNNQAPCGRRPPPLTTHKQKPHARWTALHTTWQLAHVMSSQLPMSACRFMYVPSMVPVPWCLYSARLAW